MTLNLTGIRCFENRNARREDTFDFTDYLLYTVIRLTDGIACLASFLLLPDLFRWVAEQNPKALKDRRFQILHTACHSLRRFGTSDLREICEYIVQQAPELVRVKGKKCGELPIQSLLASPRGIPMANQERWPLHVLKVMTLLLRIYPESFDAEPVSTIYPCPRNFDFCARLKVLLDEQTQIAQEALDLCILVGQLTNALPNSSLASSPQTKRQK